MNSMKRYPKDLKQFKPNLEKELKILLNVNYSLKKQEEKITALKSIIRKFKRTSIFN